MTSQRRLERDLPELLAQLGAGPAPDYRDDVVQRTVGLRQRPSWTFPERWLPMDLTVPRGMTTSPLRPILLVALVALAVVAAALVGSGVLPIRQPAPPYGPAANGLVVYSLDGDIYAGDLASGASRLLIDDPANDIRPAFTPTGTRIAFLRLPEGIGSDADSSVYRVDQIMVAGPDGEDVRTLTTERIAGETVLADAVWSGDGGALLVTTKVAARQVLSLIDVATGSRRVLDGHDVLHARFVPPNDDQIMYVGIDGNGRTFIFFLDLVSGSSRAMSQPLEIEAAEISPDGGSIAYSMSDAAGRSQVYVLDVLTGGTRTLALDPGIEHQGLPSWSPDGRWLLVARVHDTGLRRLGLISADGSAPSRELPTPGIDGQWIWAPDGASILFIHDELPPSDGPTPKPVIISVASLTSAPLPFRPDQVPDWQRLAP
jgi:Tol biopolymer transport system component